MAAYADYETFRSLTIMPQGNVDALASAAPGWIDAQLDYWSRQIDSRLRKRYAVPFEDPYPSAVVGWLVRIVTVRAYMRFGVDANDLQFVEIRDDARAAFEEIQEAADSAVGLFDLPLIDGGKSAISKGGPFVYSEASPYVWTDQQRDAGVKEDESGKGTSNV